MQPRLTIGVPNRTCLRVNPWASQQEGVVLLVVVMLVFLMVTLLAFMVEDQHLLFRRVSNQNVAEQGYQYAQGANAWAMRLLHDDLDRTTDHQKEDWAKIGQIGEPQESVERDRFSLDREDAEEEEPLPTIDFGEVPIDFFVMDLQARYNINNLYVPTPANRDAQKRIFYNILELAGLTEYEQKDELYDSLLDWMDPNEEEQPNGFESGNYASLELPYYAADQPLSSLGELRFVKGFTPQIIADLEPFVTVLPAENVPVNINSGSAEVLASLSSGALVNSGALAGIVELRKQPEFLGFIQTDINLVETAIINASGGEAALPVRGMLSINSQYYQINVKVTLDKSVYCMRTKIYRDSRRTDAKIADSIKVLSREYDPLCLNHRPLAEVNVDDIY